MACRSKKCLGGKAGSQVVVRAEPVTREGISSPRITTADSAHKIVLSGHRSVEGSLMMTAAVRDLHRAYPGRFLTAISSPHPYIWEGNPHISDFPIGEGNLIEMDCSRLLARANEGSYHFVHAFVDDLEQKMGLRLPCTEMKGEIYIGDEDKKWAMKYLYEKQISDFWLLEVGDLGGVGTKWWPREYYQAVVDYFRGRITFLTIGSGLREDTWEPLDGVVVSGVPVASREALRLVYHSSGLLCSTGMLMHAAAATPAAPGLPHARPAVVLAGGREPTQWNAYPGHKYLGSQGTLKCCLRGGCWRNYVSPGLSAPEACKRPVTGQLAKCMQLITPDHVIQAIESYYKGGILEYKNDSQPQT